VPCGGRDQPCCNGANGGGGACAEPFTCNNNGRCAPCGAQNQACCAGRYCHAGTQCTNNRCQ
jgi:hypothetical protein